MTRLKLQYIHDYIDVRGKRRIVFRRRGFKTVPLPGLPGSPEFTAAYQAALERSQPTDIGASRTKPGSIDALIIDYYRSEAFTRALSPASQRMRRNILERFRAVNGGNQATGLRREHVKKQIEGRKPFAQKNWLEHCERYEPHPLSLCCGLKNSVFENSWLSNKPPFAVHCNMPKQSWVFSATAKPRRGDA